jgi:hypothetical protein
VGGVYARLEWYSEVWKRASSNTRNLVVGEGFGKPLISFHDQEGVEVRQPHSTHLSVLARLGLLGAAFWALFHFSILHRFLYAFRRRRYLRKESSDLVLWLFLFYLLAMILTSVQPYLEFSYGAIPFYFLIGFALGIMRWQLPQEFAETIQARETLSPYPVRGFLPLRPVASGAGVTHAGLRLD